MYFIFHIKYFWKKMPVITSFVFFLAGLVPIIPCVSQSLSHVQLFATSGTVAHPVPLSMGFSRQEHWGELSFLLQEIFPTQGLNPRLWGLLHWQVDSLPLSHLKDLRERRVQLISSLFLLILLLD